VAIAAALLPSVADAADITVFGPNRYERQRGKPTTYTNVFRSTPGSGRLILTNGDRNGRGRVSSANVVLNGEQVLGPNAFSKNRYRIEVPLSNLLRENHIVTRITSTPGGFVTLQIVGSTVAAPVSQAAQALKEAADAPVTVEFEPSTNLVAFVTTTPDHPIPVYGPGGASLEGASPQEVSLAFIASYGEAFGTSDPSELQIVEVQTLDNVHISRVRLQQLHQGVPVMAAELMILVRGANVVAIQAKTLPHDRLVDTNPTVTSSEAVYAAQQFVEAAFGVTTAAFSAPALELFNRGIFFSTRTATMLAWKLEARDSNAPLHERIWVEAHTGRIIEHASLVVEAVVPQVYDATGPGPPIPVTTFPSGDSAADNAFAFASDTYNYFWTVHGRDSWDGQGAPIVVNIHEPCVGATAYWIGQVHYCDGQPVVDDVIGHEITHGVFQTVAAFHGFDDSEYAILSEGYAYIFGELVDLYNGSDGAGGGVLWAWAEDISGEPLVDMKNPGLSGLAEKASDPQVVCGNGDDPAHRNAFILAHAAALMSEGGTEGGITVNGIGVEKTAEIHYLALVGLLRASTFRDNYRALQLACTHLGSPGVVTADDCVEVKKALDAVAMARPLCPAFIVTGNSRHTVDVRLSRGDGTFDPPFAIGEDLGVNYGSFTIVGTDFFAATDENPSRLYRFTRTRRFSFEQTFVRTLEADPKSEPDYGLGLTAGEVYDASDSLTVDGIRRYVLENVNVQFRTGSWIARGNLCFKSEPGDVNFGQVIATLWLLCENGAFQDAFDFSSVFTGWTLSKSSNSAYVDNDDFQDMLVAEQAAGSAVSSKVYLLKGRKDTNSVPPRFYFDLPVHVFATENLPASSIALGDFNNDGAVDAIVGQDDDGDPGAAFLFLGHGDGTFEASGREVFDVVPDIESGSDQPGSGMFQPFDANGDGILDIVSAYKKKGIDDPDEGSRLVFLRGRGNGQFDPPVTISDSIIFRTAFSTPTTSRDEVFVLP
jgi:Zn-dependent metalloprotease